MENRGTGVGVDEKKRRTCNISINKSRHYE